MRKDIPELNCMLRAHSKMHGRSHLPWRTTHDPYRILVSEVMLQQTQVERVIPFYKKFLKTFPDVKSLSRASLPKVLKLWQGLGYNRRGKMLRDAAVMLEKEFGGNFPRKVEDIEKLPGVGPYTARAIGAFAFNKPEVFLETNIRSVFLHHFFDNRRSKVLDTEILPLVAEAVKSSRMQPRDFYAALMDYGSSLKRSGVRNNAQSSHYIKQSTFKGSRRQLRGQILKLLLREPMTSAQLQNGSGRKLSEVKEELTRLEGEKLIRSQKKLFLISR